MTMIESTIMSLFSLGLMIYETKHRDSIIVRDIVKRVHHIDEDETDTHEKLMAKLGTIG